MSLHTWAGLTIHTCIYTQEHYCFAPFHTCMSEYMRQVTVQQVMVIQDMKLKRSWRRGKAGCTCMWWKTSLIIFKDTLFLFRANVLVMYLAEAEKCFWIFCHLYAGWNSAPTICQLNTESSSSYRSAWCHEGVGSHQLRHRPTAATQVWQKVRGSRKRRDLP